MSRPPLSPPRVAPGHPWLRAAGAALVLLALAACGEPSPEAKLASAEEELAAAESGLERARAELERRQKTFDAARSSLEKARETVARAEERVAEAQDEVAEHATDDLLFRRIQRMLLEDPKLSRTAIRADVRDGVVTLEGEATSEKTRDRAVELVQDVPGVRDVRDRIALPAPPSEGEGSP